MLKDIKSKGKDMRCNDIARGGSGWTGGWKKRGRYRGVEEDARCIAYTTSIFIHQPRFRFLPGEDSIVVFPGNARCTADRAVPIAQKFSRRRIVAIRYRDSVKSDGENALTRGRVHSSTRIRDPSIPLTW